MGFPPAFALMLGRKPVLLGWKAKDSDCLVSIHKLTVRWTCNPSFLGHANLRCEPFAKPLSIYALV